MENALAAHAAVFESAVMAVPDAMLGERVGAVVAPKPGKAWTPTSWWNSH